MSRANALMRWAIASARDWRDIESLVPETGIDVVDADHRVLLEYVVSLNLLAEDAARGFDEELLRRQKTLLEGLLDYTCRHFRREERLILRLGSPAIELQRREHARIVEALEERVADFAAGRLTVSPELRRSIFEWFVEHIAGTDFSTFRLTELTGVLEGASNWDDLREILRSTGVDALDSEHRALSLSILDASFALRRCAESAHRGGHQGCDESALAEFRRDAALRLRELERVCAGHFSDEEAFMSGFDVPGLEEQRTAHAAFLTRVRSIAGEAEAGRDSPEPAALNRELFSWLADHVNRLDYDCFRRGDWIARAFESKPAAAIEALVRRTGIEAVDRQHREFVHLAADFAAALRGSADPAAAGDRLKRLEAYAARHFSDEEALFPPAAANADRHRDEHRRLLGSLGAYSELLAQGRVGAADAARSIVLGLWIGHTNGPDIETFGSEAMGGRHDELQ